MKTTLFVFLLFSCCLFALLDTGSSSQTERLWKFIKSRRESKSVNKGLSVPFNGKDDFLQIHVSPQDGLAEADKIDKLPGQPMGVNFDQYAGYVTVYPENGRALFYYFVESPRNSAPKPLVLWLNGGPGCSSLGHGAMEELGPFRVNSDGKSLFKNEFAWNYVANIIFLESPAGVGFSYSNTTSDYDQSGDERSANDAYTFLINWLDRFPQYKTSNFFIAGESYAGHYVPQLAYKIITNNKKTNYTVINFKGIAIGNALVENSFTNIAGYDYFWTHALISDETHEAIVSNCNFTNGRFNIVCKSALKKVDKEVGNINGYDIYAPLCHSPSKGKNLDNSVNNFNPCSDYYVNSYLNNAEVQKALHANVTGLPYLWNQCSDIIGWKDSPTSILPTIKNLIDNGISVWMYSGDTDSVISVTDTRYSINALGLPVENSWRPWYTRSEVGGYVVGYKGLTFVTVRGAGHEVPSYQPERSLTMFGSFLESKLPPSS